MINAPNIGPIVLVGLRWDGRYRNGDGRIMPTIVLGDLTTFYEYAVAVTRCCSSMGLGQYRGLGSAASALERAFTVVAYNVRGHGKTDKPEADIRLRSSLVDAAEPDHRARIGPGHVVGLSMGGMIAFQLAVDRPELVRSLVIVNSGPELVPRTWREKLAIAQRRFIVRTMGMRKMGPFSPTACFRRQTRHPSARLS